MLSDSKKKSAALVVYYSFDGNTRLVAQRIAQTTDADLLELKVEKEPRPRGLAKYFLGGKQVMMRARPALLPWDCRFDQYDLVFIGTPVWAFRHAPALETFLHFACLRGKKIALFCCHGGMKGQVFSSMKSLLAENTIIGEIDFVEPLRDVSRTWAERVGDWARQMLSQVG